MYDTLDKKVLTSLRENARAEIREHSKIVDAPKSTVHDRIMRLKKQNTRFVTLIDWEKTGCPFGACVIASFEESLVNHPSVNSCCIITPHQILAECLFSTALEFQNFKDQFNSAKIYPIISVLKREGFRPFIAGLNI